MPCYWRQCSEYRHCRPPVSPTSCVSTRKRPARAAAAGHRADPAAEEGAEAAVAGAVAAAGGSRGRFGLGWRAALAAGVLTHLDRIDLRAVIGEGDFAPPRRD